MKATLQSVEIIVPTLQRGNVALDAPASRNLPEDGTLERPLTHSHAGAWERCLLKDVADVIAGQSPPSDFYNKNEEGLAFYQGKTDFGDKYPVERSWCTGNKHKEAVKDDILLSVRAPVGPVNICQKRSIIGRGLSAIRVKNGNSFEYLYYYLKNNEHKVAKLGTGSTFKAITQSQISKIVIPLPPLDDQIRIATVLTRAEKLIATRKESIKALDELLKSTFLEMFGFNGNDFKKWDVEHLNTNTEIVSGVTKGKKYNSSFLREVPYMRVANVQDGHLNLTEIKTIEVTEVEIQQFKLRKGDLLLTEGGDPDKLGRGAVWNDEIDECIHQNHIFRVRVKNTSINPIFLSALIASKYGKSYFLKAAKQTTGIASINSTQLKAFPFVKPPLPLQNQFAVIVEKVESLKSRYTQNLAELESLYGSLSQRAFKGELDLSGVEILSEHGFMGFQDLRDYNHVNP
jgi:type I restriction enzyme S subunit